MIALPPGGLSGLDPTMGSRQMADGGLVSVIQNAMQVASKAAAGAVTATVKQMAGPLGPELAKIEYLMWKRMLYEHTMWLDHRAFVGIDAAMQDMNRRMAWLKSQQPQVRQALITIFTTAGLDAAIEYRRALRKQIPDAFFWATAM